jgi:hypothetical protein
MDGGIGGRVGSATSEGDEHPHQHGEQGADRRSEAPRRIEVISGPDRRRRWTRAEKEDPHRPGRPGPLGQRLLGRHEPEPQGLGQAEKDQSRLAASAAHPRLRPRRSGPSELHVHNRRRSHRPGPGRHSLARHPRLRRRHPKVQDALPLQDPQLETQKPPRPVATGFSPFAPHHRARAGVREGGVLAPDTINLTP